MPLPIAGAALLAGGSILGGLLGGSSAKKAARIQADAARYAADLQDRQFQQTRADFAPWREAGGAAITEGAAMLRPGYDYTASPGYQWRLGEGRRAVEGSAASRGLLHSGGTLKGIMRFAQGLAADDFNDQFNRQMAIAGGGQQANTTVGQLGAGAAARQGDYLTDAARARASGYIGQANAFQGILGNLAGLYMGGAFGKGF